MTFYAVPKPLLNLTDSISGSRVIAQLMGLASVTRGTCGCMPPICCIIYVSCQEHKVRSVFARKLLGLSTYRDVDAARERRGDRQHPRIEKVLS